MSSSLLPPERRCDPELPPCLAEAVRQAAERLHRSALSCFGFHHPNMERLRGSIDQHMEVLTKAFVDTLAKVSESVVRQKAACCSAPAGVSERQCRRLEAALSRGDQLLVSSQDSARLMRCLGAWTSLHKVQQAVRQRAQLQGDFIADRSSASTLRLYLSAWAHLGRERRKQRQACALAEAEAAMERGRRSVERVRACTLAAVQRSGEATLQALHIQCFSVWVLLACRARCGNTPGRVEAAAGARRTIARAPPPQAYALLERGWCTSSLTYPHVHLCVLGWAMRVSRARRRRETRQLRELDVDSIQLHCKGREPQAALPVAEPEWWLLPGRFLLRRCLLGWRCGSQQVRNDRFLEQAAWQPLRRAKSCEHESSTGCDNPGDRFLDLVPAHGPRPRARSPSVATGSWRQGSRRRERHTPQAERWADPVRHGHITLECDAAACSDAVGLGQFVSQGSLSEEACHEPFEYTRRHTRRARGGLMPGLS